MDIQIGSAYPLHISVFQIPQTLAILYYFISSIETHPEAVPFMIITTASPFWESPNVQAVGP